MDVMANAQWKSALEWPANFFLSIQANIFIKTIFFVFNETVTFPELKTVFGFLIDLLGVEYWPFLLGFLSCWALQDGSCSAKGLNTPSHNDFELGDEDSYLGSLLGTCNSFKVDDEEIKIKVTNTATDDWMGETIKILLSDGKLFVCDV